MSPFEKVFAGGKHLLALPNIADELAKTLNRIAVFDAASGEMSIEALRTDLGLLIGLVAVGHPDLLRRAFAIHRRDANAVNEAIADPGVMESVVRNEANALRAERN
jgi:hypothetical protein